LSLNVVTLTGTFLDGSGQPVAGQVTFAPSVELVDATSEEIVCEAPVVVAVNSGGQFSVQLYATDNVGLVPAGWTWSITELISGLAPYTWSFFLPYTSGSTQDISALTPALPVAPMAAYLPESGGTVTGLLTLGGSPAALTATTGTLASGSGPTTGRPSASAAGVAAMWFDTTLGIPVWSDGSAWVNATGTPV